MSQLPVTSIVIFSEFGVGQCYEAINITAIL